MWALGEGQQAGVPPCGSDQKPAEVFVPNTRIEREVRARIRRSRLPSHPTRSISARVSAFVRVKE